MTVKRPSEEVLLISLGLRAVYTEAVLSCTVLSQIATPTLSHSHLRTLPTRATPTTSHSHPEPLPPHVQNNSRIE
ncbi:uncharacterized [Tachysurus ichikawai]